MCLTNLAGLVADAQLRVCEAYRRPADVACPELLLLDNAGIGEIRNDSGIYDARHNIQQLADVSVPAVAFGKGGS